MEKSKSELPLIGKKGTSQGKKSKKRKNKEKSKGKDKEKGINDESRNKKHENQVNKIENRIEESGLPMAFNVIFSELISKQIMPENFFTYTSLRLKELGQEIEGLKVKEPLYIERLEVVVPPKRFKTEGDKIIKPSNVFMTVQQKRKKSSTKTNRSNDNEKNN